MAEVIPARLTGRCANGAERDQGTVTHALPADASELSGRAICGARPGRRSAGWCPRPELAVSCARCLKRLERKRLPCGCDPNQPRAGGCS